MNEKEFLMADKKQNPFILFVTSYYDGQCTGYGTNTNLVAVFDHKPTMEEVAPMLTDHLPANDMGRAISILSALLSKGEAKGGGYTRADLELKQVKWNTELNLEW
jgi:hypothetical protein